MKNKVRPIDSIYRQLRKGRIVVDMFKNLGVKDLSNLHDVGYEITVDYANSLIFILPNYDN